MPSLASFHPYVLISHLPPSLPSAWIIDLAEPKTPKPPKKRDLSHDSHPAGYSARTSHACPPCLAVDRADVGYLCAIFLLCPPHPLLRLFTPAYYTCHVASLYKVTTSIRKIHPTIRPLTHTYGIFSLRIYCATSYRIDWTSHGTTDGPRSILGPILYKICRFQRSYSSREYRRHYSL